MTHTLSAQTTSVGAKPDRRTGQGRSPGLAEYRVWAVARWVLTIAPVGGFVAIEGSLYRLPWRGLVALICLGGFLALVALGRTDLRALAIGLCSLAAVSVLAFVQILFAPDLPAADSAFVGAAATYVGSYGAVLLLASVAFNGQSFASTFHKASTWGAMVALSSWTLSTLLQRQLFVNWRPGLSVPRLQGLAAEPSAWAPIAGAMLYAAIQERNRRQIVLWSAVAALTQSPIVYAVSGLGVALAVARSKGVTAKLLLAFLAAALVLGIALVDSSIDRQELLESDGLLQNTVGRGLSAFSDDSEVGSTQFAGARVQSALTVVDEVAKLDSWLLGIGPGANVPYFAVVFPDQGQVRGVRPNNLPIEVLFDFGALGLVVLSGVAVVAFRRVRNLPGAHVLGFYFLASLVNSAGGFLLYMNLVVGVGAAIRHGRAGVRRPRGSGGVSHSERQRSND